MISEIGMRRLHNQRVASGRFAHPGDVVRHLGAMQAQDYHQALWAIASRMERGATVADIEQSIADREIVLTWSMRGTIHAVPPENARWMLATLAPRLLAGDKRRLEQLELTPDILARSKELVLRALEECKLVTRPHLMQLLEDSGVRTDGQRGYHLLWRLAQEGLICLGPREGKQQTFALLDDWIPRERNVPREEAIAMFAERYFAGHGPATAQDFAWWAGLTLTDARRSVELVRDRLESAVIGDQAYWSAPSAADTEDKKNAYTEPSVYLLAGFDEFLLGYKDRSAVIREEHARFVTPGNNGVFLPMIVIDGRVAGIWKRTIKSKGVDIVLHPFAKPDDRADKLQAAAMGYGRFLGLPLLSVDMQILKA